MYPPLSPAIEGSFAYKTMKDRVPVIITHVVNALLQQCPEVSNSQKDKEVENDIKKIIGCLSKLRYEIMTNKELLEICDNEEDTPIWNEYLRQEKTNKTPTWFNCTWLYVECYAYRRIMEPINNSSFMKHLDPFQAAKQNVFMNSLASISSLLEYALLESAIVINPEEIFTNLLHISLWGNRCDLSLSAGQDCCGFQNSLLLIKTFAPCILCDNTLQIWNFLNEDKYKKRFDYILDNAGYEFLSDLVLAHFLIANKFCEKIVFHGKASPWFVSDVNKGDCDWTLAQLFEPNEVKPEHKRLLNEFGKICTNYIANGTWAFNYHTFWTLPYDYVHMKSISADLYNELESSDLLIFKGDLNYRKLASDLQWPVDTPFVEMLRNFRPSNICAIRTLKADTCTGLNKERAAEIAAHNKNWMVTGDYGVIQFVAKKC